MSRTIKVLILGMLALFTTGCSSTMIATPLLEDPGRLDMHGAKIVSRPLEYGVVEGERVSAQAKHARILGFIPVEGNNVSLSAPILGIDSRHSRAQAEACKTIMDNHPDADGLLVTQAIIEKGGIWPFYTYEIATVKGRTIELVNNGMLEGDQLTVFRMGAASQYVQLPRSEPQKDNVFTRLLGFLQ